MEVLLDEICGRIHNYFLAKPDGIHVERFNISSKTIDLDFLQENQYFRIKGSVFNDGVHKYPATDLVDEEFIGEIWAMAVPPAVIALLADIQKWQDKYGDVNSINYSPFTSESFNNYSYSKGSRSSSSDGSSADAPLTWYDVFGAQLRRWRKL